MKRMLHTGLLAVILLLGAIGGSYLATWQGLNVSAQESSPMQPLDEASAFLADEQNTIDIVERFGGSVVAVNVEFRGQMIDPFQQFQEQLPPQFRDFFRFQLPQQPREFNRQGSGSGFVISDDGMIITNYHVVAEALEPGTVNLREGGSISVTFAETSEEVAVTVVGANELFDIALLRLDNASSLPDNLTPLTFANSDEVRVGQKVIAIGNPFGLQSTVTTGIVSAVSRDFPTIGRIEVPMIQTDASINPGNSGGPLLNSRGEVIGVNTAIIPGISAGGQRGNIGIGFAVPSNFVTSNLASLERGGFVDLRSRPRLGISFVELGIFPESVRESLNLPEQGVSVQEVEPGSAAKRAGIRGGDFNITIEGRTTDLRGGGDVIVAVDGEQIRSGTELQQRILTRQEGDTVELTVVRDGEELVIPVTLAVVPQEQQAVADEPRQDAQTPDGPRLGVTIQNVAALPAEVRRSLNLPENGAMVVAVQPGSAAANAGLRGSQFSLSVGGEAYPVGGDIILAVDDDDVTSVEDLQRLITSRSNGDTVSLQVWRNGSELTLEATL
jgi:serine protease Do